MISADWSAPSHVQAFTTTRLGGCSEGAYQSLNLGDHVGDLSARVAANRERLCQQHQWLKTPQWLSQVHGTTVLKASEQGVVEADACWTDAIGQPCIVMTADCLPVFFTDRAGSRVAIAHAGWRGLVDGVLEQTLSVFSDPADVQVWLGPAIGPQAFEVGDDVRERFCDVDAASHAAFIAAKAPHKWLANIYQLARLRLNAAGVQEVTGGNYCTFSQSELFYSYRREGVTGRMASMIWIN
ncbi:peptidoglycan editing factor PgeF [Amphritea sp. 1_MG-2023]|uniref:peptidoglycan editing factor PgeF n=1 Tax=Amphritea sp. 1_MG-2023 TaxID=3062670 RepID=UPI0026E33093|nr:peptidoglycan editing factor PgeF [Amphritea sp. 1_MG-2023]MDO6563622.1 peptidoglycan editing factor PgeF [Amphritea sp. 1_MG-2023]